MKKILFTLLAFTTLSLAGWAQSAVNLSDNQRQFRNQIENFLRNEGFTPLIDKDDESVTWKRNGSLYWATIAEEAPFQVRMYKSGFRYEDLNSRLTLEAVNNANALNNCAKASIDFKNKAIIFAAEFFCFEPSDFSGAFKKRMQALDEVKDKVAEHYKNNEQ